LDSNKLVRASGWHPQIDFHEGLERAWTAALLGRNARPGLMEDSP
jgi:hypothetical protein